MGIDKNSITDWVRKYLEGGYEGLKEAKACKVYPKDCNWLQTGMYYPVIIPYEEQQRSIIFQAKVF
ncbi:helix-turn-helix domain containing protein [Paenibacillus bouchesdurhonensis]|uniref:helix-turn-helix domain containing protein n=1 Tax=Paenibacillus bouchesdurhonensis TaxID=1870990 RepID=UPI000DA60865|nr:helix-turn-helix domain containing protein [Paenibacillus bouchesdurhonensis]